MVLIKRKADGFFTEHKYFAWYPITFVDRGEVVTVWMKNIKRKLVSNMTGTYWTYSL